MVSRRVRRANGRGNRWAKADGSAQTRGFDSAFHCPVKTVALRMGYANPLYFSRQFRARFGMSPREVIRRYRIVPG